MKAASNTSWIIGQRVERRKPRVLLPKKRLNRQAAPFARGETEVIEQRPRPFRRSAAAAKEMPLVERGGALGLLKPLAYLVSLVQAAPAERESRADALFPVILCAIAALIFGYDVLLWQSSRLGEIRLPQDAARVRSRMLDYAGVRGAATVEGERVEAESGDAIPLDTVEFFSWKEYTVRPGDSVSRIAANHGLSMDAIIALNNLTNARRLSVGETLRIPNMDGIPYRVARGDSLPGIAERFGVPLEAVLDANDIQSDALTLGEQLFIPGARLPSSELRKALGNLFIYPVQGKLTSGYGWRISPITNVRSFHSAVDLAGNTGTPVKAAMDGKVAEVGYNAVYGNFIILSHDNGFQTMYAHLSAVSAAKGSRVIQGGKIGAIGSTGQSTGPHLHFAVYKNGRAVNPLEYLK